MNVFGIGLPEMAVIAAIALLVFGPKRLPELGKTLGRTLKGFQSASQGFEEQFRTALEPTSESSKPTATTVTASSAEVPAGGESVAGDAAPSGGSSPS